MDRKGKYNGVKVFSATRTSHRERLGEHVEAWLREHPTFEVVDRFVVQSSDKAYHCLTLVITYKVKASAE